MGNALSATALSLAFICASFFYVVAHYRLSGWVLTVCTVIAVLGLGGVMRVLDSLSKAEPKDGSRTTEEG